MSWRDMARGSLRGRSYDIYLLRGMYCRLDYKSRRKHGHAITARADLECSLPRLVS